MNKQSNETEETRRAFRAGITGMPFSIILGAQKERTVHTGNQGEIEKIFETIDRLPGLSDPEQAYESGRAVRFLGAWMDKHGSSLTKADRFRVELANAIVAAFVSNNHQPWGAMQTAETFITIFTDRLEDDAPDQIRKGVTSYASKRPT